MGRRVVLVHGAWHGAWAWERALPLLRDAGVEAVAVDLPGHGDDTGPLGDLHGDAARVRAELDRSEDDTVLVGHSYGGAVITEAGDHPAVGHLVYLCALAIDAGETCARAAVDEAAKAGISHEGRPNLADALIIDGDQLARLDPDLAAACLYNDCDDETTRSAVKRLGAQPLITIQQEPAAVAWRSRPSTYVVCRDDLGIHPDLQRVLAKRCTSSVEWPTGHSPFFSRPELVADLLIGLAR